MGKAKQLLPYHGESLLGHAARTASESLCHPVLVVLGANATQLRRELRDAEVYSTVNEFWPEGIGSSIRFGVATLEQLARIEALVIMLCDQPLVEANVIDRLVRTYLRTRVPVVASKYEKDHDLVVGAPALFGRALFPELLNLRGNQGARQVVARHRRETVVVEVPEAVFDVDTPRDYEMLQNGTEQQILPVH